MNKNNWKSKLCSWHFGNWHVAFLRRIDLHRQVAFLTSAGLLSWLVLLALTLAASRFTVSITNSVGVNQSRKSVADAFVFLAVILYAVPPAETAGPATLLAAIVGFVSTYGLASRRESIATTAIAVISTFVSASCYGFSNLCQRSPCSRQETATECLPGSSLRAGSTSILPQHAGDALFSQHR